MSDYKKPRTNLNDFLPAQNRSAFLQNVNENLFNRFLTKDEYDHLVGLIGDSEASNPLKQIVEPTAYRQLEQLQPVVAAQIGSETPYMSFPDYLQRMSRLDVDVNDFAQWGSTLQFNYVPPIDIDKLVNYSDYYWDSPISNDIPDYITIKNQKNWTLARSNEFKKTLTKIATSYSIKTVDQFNVTITGNYLSAFNIGDYVLMVDGKNDYFINQVSNIILNQSTGLTEISMLNNFGDLQFTTMYNFNFTIKSTNLDNSFTLSGDFSSIFTADYIFLTINPQNPNSELWSVKNSIFDPVTNTTNIYVNQNITSDKPWSTISMLPLASLADAEYNSVLGNSTINYDTLWNNIFIGGLVWYRELPLIYSNTGYSYLGGHGLYDNQFDFVAAEIRPGDTLKISNGTNTGTYTIISVETNFLGIDSSVSMFTKTNLQYNIVRDNIYDYIVSPTAPTYPVLYQLWSNSTDDTLQQFDGVQWNVVVSNISLIVNATHQRYKLSLTQTDPWSLANNWIHKNELQSFSGKSRAQLPIIEFDPFLELSTTSLATYEWKYRVVTNNLYADSTTQPTLFEISNIKVSDIYTPEYVFINSNTIMLDPKFGNIVADIAIGSRIKIAGTNDNDGLYYVSQVIYKQPSKTTAFRSYITLTQNISNPLDVPVGSSIGPEKTSKGDNWLGFDKHWIFYGVKNTEASSVSPTRNPMLDILVNSITNTTLGYESNVGLVWQTFSYFNDNNIGSLITFDPSLAQIVLYDDYQEGDIRVYINGIRQYGNFQDIQSTVDSNYIGAIQFDDSVSINGNDLVRIELGEYGLADIGRGSIPLVTQANLVDPSLPYDLLNITNYRRIEQDKIEKNIYPFFNIYDVHGNAKSIASRIFAYKEDQTYPVNLSILRRIVNNTTTNDYGFVQELSNADTGELYSYKNFSQPNSPLQTIWKRGLNNEQYVPQKLSDGSWEIPNPWYYNIDHELRSDINLAECLEHFTSIIASQKIPGLVNSTNINQIHLDDNINYGLGGTIKEHNNGLDLSVSSVFVNNVTPLQLIQFAHDQYLNGYNFIQEEYVKNVAVELTNASTLPNMEAFLTYLSTELIDIYETNEKFNEWYGDSSTYNSQNVGIQNWISTLPFFGLVPKKVCYTLVDESLGLNAVSCHDGHIQDVGIQLSVIQSILNSLIKSGTTNYNRRCPNFSKIFGRDIISKK
jgi:hypothetical protein